MADAPEPFASRLARLRAAAGLSISELARRAGLSRQQVTNYEAGRQAPSAAALAGLAAALGVNMGAFDGCGFE